MKPKTMFPLVAQIVGLALLLSAVTSPAAAQVEGYMKVMLARGPVPADATDPEHRGWINLKSITYSPTKVANSVTVTKGVSNSSEALARLNKQAIVIADVWVDNCKGGKCTLRLKMRGVTITSFQVSSGPTPIETIVFSAQQLTEEPVGQATAEPTKSPAQTPASQQ